MHLIEPLAAGINGAGSGHAEICSRGTSTRATYYTDFEGTSGGTIATGANITLDSNGGAEIYVNEVVDVVVKDSNGTTVREFTSGKSAPGVEVRSASFTGSHYETSTSAASNPLSLQSVLDAWLTSAGANAVDWKVLVGGSVKNLTNAFGSFADVFYNVKDPTYGATGNGSTDDSTAIQGAIDAAEAASGGIVFFPPGTYYVETGITLPGKVSLWGAGPNATTLSVNHASNNLLETEATLSPNEHQEIRNMRLTAAQSNSGNLLDINTATLIGLENVHFDGTNSTGIMCLVAAAKAANVWINDCTFEGSSASALVSQLSTTAKTIFTGCKFIQPTAAVTASISLSGGDNLVANCYFDNSAATSGTTTGIVTTAGNIIVTNCFFSADSGAATSRGINYGTITTSRYVCDSGCVFACDSAYVAPTITGGDGTNGYLGSRIGRTDTVATDADPYALNVVEYGHIFIERSDATAQTFTAVDLPQGSRFTLCIYNGHVANTTEDVNTTDFLDIGTITIATTKYRVLEFEMVYLNSVLRWALVSDSGDIG